LFLAVWVKWVELLAPITLGGTGTGYFLFRSTERFVQGLEFYRPSFRSLSTYVNVECMRSLPVSSRTITSATETELPPRKIRAVAIAGVAFEFDIKFWLD